MRNGIPILTERINFRILLKRYSTKAYSYKGLKELQTHDAMRFGLINHQRKLKALQCQSLLRISVKRSAIRRTINKTTYYW